jgi:hypothetical protein
MIIYYIVNMLHSCPVILESSKARFIIEINVLQSHLLPRMQAITYHTFVLHEDNYVTQ